MKTSERLYRVLLGAYPRDFRDEYADEMASVFRLNLDEGYLSAW